MALEAEKKSTGGTTPPLLVWVVTDGRTGIENQARGLAEALGRQINCDIKKVVVPRSPLSFLKIANSPPRGMQAPWPDVWIGCGRASLRHSAGVRRWSSGKTFVVQLQHPRRDTSLFDLVIAPKHDDLQGKNVVSITGASNRISPARLTEASETFKDQLQTVPAPRLAVVLGGNSKRYKLDKEKFAELLEKLKKLHGSGIGLLITTSRRTPGFARKKLRKWFAGAKNAWVWTGHKADGPNPYFAFLAASDAVLATSDSTNMLTDAASAGKPILMYALPGNSGKFSELHDDLEERGYVRSFTGALSSWEVEPLQETRRAAEAVLRGLHQHMKAAK